MLRQYRQARGVEPETLAASLHVPVNKILALEEDRLEVMPDIMFARALAMSVCRYLKVDPTPVLARMPHQDASRLAARDERGIDSPLSRPSLMPEGSMQMLQRLVDAKVLAAAVVVMGLLYLWLQTGNPPSSVSQPGVVETIEPPPTAPAAASTPEGGGPSSAESQAPAPGAGQPASAPTPTAAPALPATVTTPVTAVGVGK